MQARAMICNLHRFRGSAIRGSINATGRSAAYGRRNDGRHRKPVEIQGTGAMMMRPTSSATRYGQIGSDGFVGLDPLPIVQAR